MVALLGREFVNLPLLCGNAEHSHDASGPPTAGACSSSLSAGGSSSSWMIFWLLRSSALLCLSPFSPQLGQLPPLPLVPAVPSCPILSSFLSPCSQHPRPLCPGQLLSDSSSLCAPRCEHSDPVSADGVLQEACHLLTVLLNSTHDVTWV